MEQGEKLEMSLLEFVEKHGIKKKDIGSKIGVNQNEISSRLSEKKGKEFTKLHYKAIIYEMNQIVKDAEKVKLWAEKYISDLEKSIKN